MTSEMWPCGQAGRITSWQPQGCSDRTHPRRGCVEPNMQAGMGCTVPFYFHIQRRAVASSKSAWQDTPGETALASPSPRLTRSPLAERLSAFHDTGMRQRYRKKIMWQFQLFLNLRTEYQMAGNKQVFLHPQLKPQTHS